MAKVYEVMQVNETLIKLINRNAICPADIAYLGAFLDFKGKWDAYKSSGGKKSDLLREIAERHNLPLSALGTRFKRLDSDCIL